VTSIVFSTDKHGTKYAAITEIQDPRVERITKLGPMVYRALKRYAFNIRGPPINIIFYRDGLSEGEYDTTAKAEMGDIDGRFRTYATGGC
jgi:eukaryotic translation initiation factor 2C